jgi:hypothetical protein
MCARDSAWQRARQGQRRQGQMAKTIGRLTAPQVDSRALKPGLHSDGGNLYLRVSVSKASSDDKASSADRAAKADKAPNRSWVFIYRWEGRQHEAGLGKAGKGYVTLKDARDKAKEGREPRLPQPAPAGGSADRVALRGPCGPFNADLRRRRRRLHRPAQAHLAQRQACRAMAPHRRRLLRAFARDAGR